jgi:hypothetical protein
MTTSLARQTTRTAAAATTRTMDAPGSRRRKWRLQLAALAFFGSVALGGGGCTHAHLSPNYGVASNAWFSAQYVRTEPADSEATRRALGTLDAQEASSISKNYRRVSSGGQSDSAGQGQMVLIGQSHGNEPYTPPPSVPSGN